MAGSYQHATTDAGQLRSNESMISFVENLGDAYETIEEMYGMIWWLADGRAGRVEQARRLWRVGMEQSPGVEATDG